MSTRPYPEQQHLPSNSPQLAILPRDTSPSSLNYSSTLPNGSSTISLQTNGNSITPTSTLKTTNLWQPKNLRAKSMCNLDRIDSNSRTSVIINDDTGSTGTGAKPKKRKFLQTCHKLFIERFKKSNSDADLTDTASDSGRPLPKAKKKLWSRKKLASHS